MNRAIAVGKDAFQLNITQGKVYTKLALHIKETFDKEFGKHWNCVVGRNFGSFVTHRLKTYIFFSVSAERAAGTSVLLWKT